MQTTSIEWTDASWNPTRGCSRVSEGCRNCYAEAIAARFSTHALQDGDEPSGVFGGFAINTPSGPRWTGKVELIESKLTEPLHWKKPRRVFVNSMSDLFHEALPDEAIDRVFAVMALCPQHTFQVLTKRATRARAYLGTLTNNGVDQVCDVATDLAHEDIANTATLMHFADRLVDEWPLRNVWLGVSVEDQATADERIPLLLQTPAAVRFVSAEPLLGPVDLLKWLRGYKSDDRRGALIPGASGHRSILGRSARENLEASALDCRQSERDAAILETSRSDDPSRTIDVGWISDHSVFGRDETPQGIRAPDRMDDSRTIGHSSGDADQPQERQTGRHASEQPGDDDALRECDPRDSGPRSNRERKRQARRSQFLRDSDEQPSYEDQGACGKNVTVEDRGDVRGCAGNSFRSDLAEKLETLGIDWVIAGGESGPHARPAHPQWFRDVRDQCQAAGVAFFFKQWGKWAEIAPMAVYEGENVKIPVRMVRVGDACVDPNGQYDIAGDDLAFPRFEGTGIPMRNIGKKSAGRLLDGQEWNEFPPCP